MLSATNLLSTLSSYESKDFAKYRELEDLHYLKEEFRIFSKSKVKSRALAFLENYRGLLEE